MPRLHVCALSQIEPVTARTGARHLVSLLSPPMQVERPAAITPEQHLHLGLSDIVAPSPGSILPHSGHVERLIAFIRAWDRRAPILIHCYAGVSRSTAAAFIAACALHPEHPEESFARAIRAASPTATPNPRLVALADDILEREGRMVEAIAAIGRGEDCFEGVPFTLELPPAR